LFNEEEHALIAAAVEVYERACADKREYGRFLQAAEPLRHSHNENLRSLFVTMREAVKLVHAAEGSLTPRQAAKISDRADHLQRKFARLMGVVA